MTYRRLTLLALLLCVVGIGVSGYLTYVHYTETSAVCVFGDECKRVQTSTYADLIGIPVALLGLLGYIALALLLLIPRSIAVALSTALALGGFGFSLYLTYREIFTLEAICPWCVVSAVIFTLLALVTAVRFLKFDE